MLGSLALSPDPTALLADAALPLIYFTLPAVVLLLIPVILLEGFLLRVWIPTSIVQALKASAISNIASTIAGVPLATLLAYAGAMAVSPWSRKLLEQEHWQSPLGDVVMAIVNSVYISAYVVEAHWLLPAALMIILVPAYLISWWIEYVIVRTLILKNPNHSSSPEKLPSAVAISRAVRRANFVSYALLFGFIAVRLVRSQF
jgi:hypothetical protein